MRHLLLLISFFVFGTNIQAQKLTKKQKKALKLEQKLAAELEAVMLVNYKNSINYLASDALDGRRTGTAGADSALQYITDAFSQIGLEAKGSKGYLQNFTINEGVFPTENANCNFNGNVLEINKDWLPLNNCGEGNISAFATITMKEYGMPWFIDVAEIYTANKKNPHFSIIDSINTFAVNAQKNGCKGLLFYNSAGKDDDFTFNPKEKLERLKIPLVYLRNSTYTNYLKKVNAPINVKLSTSFKLRLRNTSNAVGYINNNAANTIVIGAHYDHLGHGEDKNSRYTGTDAPIHNGADDNASGTAGLIEIARALKKTNYKNNNYLFIAFSGEELGLFGSKFFADSPTVSLNNINYMINMDMIGRLNDSTQTVTIGGFGTSPSWPAVIQNNYPAGLNIKIDSSGTGPSDHTSFYRKNIPVLFFFTGLHSDYHTPTDDIEKIKIPGSIAVLKKVLDVVKNTNTLGKLIFTPTKESQTTTTTRFKVTMGIMPDYAYAGAGVRADGVSEGKPAKLAGIIAGDIVTQLGTTKITSMETYMKALGEHSKGETIPVTILRAGKEIIVKVTF